MNINKVFGELPILKSENIELKKIEDVNIDEVFSIYNNDKVFKYCGIIPKHNIETVKKMIGHFERDYNKRSRVKWGVFRKNPDNKMVGIIEAMDFDQKVNKVTIGYFLAEDFWGFGYATEAVRLLLEFLFVNVDINRVHAEVMPENEASKKVLMKNGFIKEGLLRQAALWPGKGIVDLEIYSILKVDYIDKVSKS
ncbi:MAG: GNAT family N-acetyltransferase [Bacillota bacterium]